MNKGLALLLLALIAAIWPGQTNGAPTLPTWNDSGEAAWWSKNPTPDLWPQAADALQAQLEANYKQSGNRIFADSDFQGWLDHLLWIRLGLACPDDISSANDLKAFVALGQDQAVSRLFVEKLDHADDKKAALRIQLNLAKASAADLHEYAALGVAFSLVFDQPFPDDWPHRQVPLSAVPIGDLDPVQRFQFYVQANRDKKLELDPTQLTFENLKFVVDTKVSLSELAYAQQNRISYSNFGDAFFAIKYSDTRIGNASVAYTWPGSTYTLADIEKDGGICIDQAYYAETLGKGRGIPTIRFTGYGMDGAHAWFGFLTSSHRWNLDCGRYEAQNFPKGFAVDPQTWKTIDDSVLDYLFKNSGRDANFSATLTALTWAQLHQGNPAVYSAILNDAKSIMPEWSGTWKLQADLIDKCGDIEKQKAFYKDWIDQFANYPELKVEGQKRLYSVLRFASDPDAEEVLRDIIVQNRSEGFDLGISAACASMNEKLEIKDWDGAREIYERAVRDFGDDGGLTLYAKMVEPYVRACLDNDKISLADRAITFTEDRMKMDNGTQLSSEFIGLRNEVAARKLAEH
jgi:hypothetical protein